MDVEKGTTRLLIGYTISDDQTRNAFRDKLVDKYKENLVWVNESMYKLRGVLPGDLESDLNEICREIGNDNFREKDFIKWYFAPNFGNYPQAQNKDFMVEKTMKRKTGETPYSA